MSAGKALPAAIVERLRAVKASDPELTTAQLAERFNITVSTAGRLTRDLGPAKSPAMPAGGRTYVASCVCGWRDEGTAMRVTKARRAHYRQHTPGTHAATQITRSHA